MLARLTLLAILATSAFAADLTGSWKLVVSESDFGKVNPPQSQMVVVRQDGEMLEIRSALTDHRGTLTSQYRLDASGKEVRNEIRGSQSHSTASWRGDCLNVRTRTSIQSVEIKSADQWCVSAGGRKMTIYRTATTPQGDLEQKFVYEKSSDSH